jgi:hypothetical protein
MKHLVAKAGRTEKVKFLGDTVEVRVLSLKRIREFQKLAETLSGKDSANDFDNQLKVQNAFIRAAVVGAEELEDDEIEEFSPQDLEELVRQAFEINNINMNVDAEDKDSEGNPES